MPLLQCTAEDKMCPASSLFKSRPGSSKIAMRSEDLASCAAQNYVIVLQEPLSCKGCMTPIGAEHADPIRLAIVETKTGQPRFRLSMTRA
jgi:hypothetical protein